MKKEANKGHETQQKEKPADISGYIAALQESFEPIVVPELADHWFSTDEVVEAIRDIDPGAKASKEQVFQALRDAGYTYCVKPGTQGLQFRWMMRTKE